MHSSVCNERFLRIRHIPDKSQHYYCKTTVLRAGWCTDRVCDGGDDVMPQSVRQLSRWRSNSPYSAVSAAVRDNNAGINQLNADERSLPGRTGQQQQQQRTTLDRRQVQLDAKPSCTVQRHAGVLDVGQRLERPGGLVARRAAVTPPTPTSVAVRRRDARTTVQTRRHTADCRRRTSVVLAHHQHLQNAK